MAAVTFQGPIFESRRFVGPPFHNFTSVTAAMSIQEDLIDLLKVRRVHWMNLESCCHVYVTSAYKKTVCGPLEHSQPPYFYYIITVSTIVTCTQATDGAPGSNTWTVAGMRYKIYLSEVYSAIPQTFIVSKALYKQSLKLLQTGKF